MNVCQIGGHAQYESRCISMGHIRDTSICSYYHAFANVHRPSDTSCGCMTLRTSKLIWKLDVDWHYNPMKNKSIDTVCY